jgi:hypothetical protein
MKKLKLNRETIGILSGSELAQVHGGNVSIVRNTTFCPVLTNGCSGGPCVITGTGPSGSSVINPSGG